MSERIRENQRRSGGGDERWKKGTGGRECVNERDT